MPPTWHQYKASIIIVFRNIWMDFVKITGTKSIVKLHGHSCNHNVLSCKFDWAWNPLESYLNKTQYIYNIYIYIYIYIKVYISISHDHLPCVIDIKYWMKRKNSWLKLCIRIKITEEAIRNIKTKISRVSVLHSLNVDPFCCSWILPGLV